MAKNINVIKRALKVRQMVDEYYEPENQSKSKIQAFRKHIVKVYPMSERTFWRLLQSGQEATALKCEGCLFRLQCEKNSQAACQQ